MFSSFDFISSCNSSGNNNAIAYILFLQIVIWFIIPAVRSTHATNNALVLIVLLQYVPRLYLIFPLSSQIIKANGVVTKTAWAGAAYNLALYMLASHVCNAASFVYMQFTSLIQIVLQNSQ